MIIEACCVLRSDCELGEGPVWSHREMCLWFVDIESSCVHRFDPSTVDARRFETLGRPGFIAAMRGGGFVLGIEDAICVADPEFSKVHRCLAVPDLPARHRINDGHVDARGRLWFGTLNEQEDNPTGRLFRCDHGKVELAEEGGYMVTNGPATSPDGRTLYHSDSLNRQVFAFDLAADGVISRKRSFVVLAVEEGFADGITVDSAGRVWVALFGGWGVNCYSPAGELLRTVKLPVANVTKLAFGGDDLMTGYVTTARKGLTVTELQQQPLAGCVFSFRTDAPGLPANEALAGLIGGPAA